MSLKIKYVKFWTVEMVSADPSTLYIFGDNDIKRGKRGQAVIRDLENAIGIPTKKLPTLQPNAFYSDKDFILHTENIKKSMDQVIEKFKSGKFTAIALPSDGLGTGLAQLDQKAPRVFSFLQVELERLKNEIDSSLKIIP